MGMDHVRARRPGQAKGGNQLEKDQEGRLKVEPATSALALEDGAMRFDYRLREGVVAKSNAVALMRSVGLDV